MIRQGDILLIPADATPADYIQRSGEVVLGLGEVTGHRHLLQHAVWLVAPTTDVAQFAISGGDVPVFVVAGENSQLVHEEHRALKIPAGTWQVIRQREYTPSTNRFVAD